MLIGILVTGTVNAALVPRYGEYPPMFEALLSPADPGLSYRTYAALDGALPASPAECDAWLVTGSKHGVYDDLPWIEPSQHARIGIATYESSFRIVIRATMLPASKKPNMSPMAI